MTLTTKVMLAAGALLIGASVAAHVANPAPASKTRKIAAGGAFLQVPLHLPKEMSSGTLLSGSALMGSRDECDITYDRFTGVYWSGQRIPSSALLPAPAYVLLSEQAGEAVDLGRGKMAYSRTIKLSAEKPCGKIVQETLNVIDLYCSSTRTHVAIVGMQDPFMTRQRVRDIAQSLYCP